MAERWPVVGREHELARAFELLETGTGVLVVGNAGIGKTSLARLIAEHGATSGWRVAEAAPLAVPSGMPFETFGAAMPRSAATSPPAAAAVAALVSDSIPSAGPSRSTPVTTGSASRTLLVVDEMGLLDEKSAQVIKDLAVRRSVTILATGLDTTPLPQPIQWLWRAGALHRMELGGLTDAAMAQIIDGVLGGPVDPGVTRVLTGRAEGNPMLLRELIHSALDRGVLVNRHGQWLLTADPPISLGIRGLVAQRLTGLSPGLREALETIAVGEPLPARVAAAVVGESALDELESVGLIAVRPGLAGPTVASGHPLFGDVLRAELPALRGHRMRLTLAAAIESERQAIPHDLVRAAQWRVDAGVVDDPARLLEAARAARGISLDTAERLARRAHELTGSLPSTLLLAEILTHNGRFAQAAALTSALPPETLSAADREAIVYCTAMGEGLLAGDAGGGADLVAGVLAGDPAASDHLRALHSSLLAFDTRFGDALRIGTPILSDGHADPAARAFAALGVVGSEYWLGRTRRTVDWADRIADVLAAARPAAPFAAPSIELMAVCALIDHGDLESASVRADRLRADAIERGDPFGTTRGSHCVGRVALMRGDVATAESLFRSCLDTMLPFDRTFVRHLHSMLARALAARGDARAAAEVLTAVADAPRVTAYEAEFDLANAAVSAAGLDLDDAAERAGLAGTLAASRNQWPIAAAAYHDAARYGRAAQVMVPLQEAVGRVEGPLGWCYLDHATALARADPGRLDEVSRRFEALGTLLFAAEAAAEAAIAHAAAGHARAARASGSRAGRLRTRCPDAVSPWLAGATAPIPLTERERQVAAIAAAGHTDAAIAAQLSLSARTVQTHLARVYAKLGIRSRTELPAALAWRTPDTGPA